VKRRRVRVGDRVEHQGLGVGDVIHADASVVAVSFDKGIYRVRAHVAPHFLCIMVRVC